MPTALIVEDEPEANKLLSMLVQLRGYRTESAFTGTEAIEKAERHRPDVVLLDLMLPDITGFDVCRALKARRETNPIPVVMVTARVAADNRLKSFRVGASDYVPKPYTPDQIFRALTAADSWRRDLREQAGRGEIPLGPLAEADTLSQSSRLLSLLLARTAWDESEVRRLGVALLDLPATPRNGGRRTGWTSSRPPPISSTPTAWPWPSATRPAGSRPRRPPEIASPPSSPTSTRSRARAPRSS